MSERSERIMGSARMVPHDGAERSEAPGMSERSERIMGSARMVPHDGAERSEAPA